MEIHEHVVVCDIVSRGPLLSLEFGFVFAVVLSVAGAKKNPNYAIVMKAGWN